MEQACEIVFRFADKSAYLAKFHRFRILKSLLIEEELKKRKILGFYKLLRKSDNKNQNILREIEEIEKKISKLGDFRSSN